MSKYKRDLVKNFILQEDDAESSSSSSSTSSTSTSTSDDGTTTTTTTETSSTEESSSQENSTEEVGNDDGGDMDFDMDMGDDGGMSGPAEVSTDTSGGVDQTVVPNSDKKINLLSMFRELLSTSEFLLQSCIDIKDKEEEKTGEQSRVLYYIVSRMEDVVEKIKYIIMNKFVSFDYTKLTTLYVSLQANVFSIMYLLENVYGVNSNKDEAE